LRQRGDIHAMVERVLREFGRIDALVNVAAIGLGERVEDMKEETYEQIFRTNFWGTALCCQAVLKQMRSQKSGHIVNIASGGAITPYEGFALYCAAKAAVIQFSKVLALEEVKNGIVVNVVSPGPMHTAMGRESGPTEEDLRQLAASYSMPLGRPCYPEEVAEVIVLAATNSSAVLTGQTLHARGGALPDGVTSYEQSRRKPDSSRRGESNSRSLRAGAIPFRSSPASALFGPFAPGKRPEVWPFWAKDG
jgi:NAD(P)-dependent dehydrogenase (short-subunit alcohol dehydrogenase family)